MLRMLLPASVALVVFGLSLAGCSSDDDTGAGSSTGGSGAGGSGSGGTAGSGGGAAGQGGTAGTSGSGGTAGTSGSGGSGATGGAAGSGGAGGSGGPDFYQGGYVSIVQSVVVAAGTEYASYSFAAGFTRGEITSTGGGCDFQDDGPCRITDCTTQSADAGTPSYETASAGVLTLTGGNQPLTLTPDASGSYTPLSGQEKLWSGGATLTIAAAGADVPAFQETLYGAAPVTMTSPALPPAGTQATFSTSAPLTLTWTGGTGGTVTAMLTRSIQGSTTRTVMLSCTYPATDGSGTVPASAMGALPPGADGTFVLQGGDLKTIEPGGWTITLQEYVPALTPEGNVASAMVTYQ